MKQTIKNFGKALLGLVMPVKHQPLSDGWIKQNDKEIKKSVKSSAFRPRWMSKLNTTVKNEFKSEREHKTLLPISNDIKLDINNLTVEQYYKYVANGMIVVNNNGETTIDSSLLNDNNGLTTEQKLKDALDKLGSQPGYCKFEKSDKEYIKCDGTGQMWHRDEVYYYAPADLHLSKDFFRNVTKKQLEDNFDIDNDNDFRAWVADKLLKVREF